MGTNFATGMCGIINSLIKDWLLTEKSGITAYINSFRSLILPTGWPRFQNPISHHKSYGFAEKLRLSLMQPFIFADFLSPKYCRAESVSRINKEFRTELSAGLSFRAIVIRLFVFSATNSYLVAKSPLTAHEQGQLVSNMLSFRIYLQRFVKLTGTLKDEAAGDKLTKRPNMHQALHVAKYLEDYATTVNCDVSLGEAKHRHLKDKAQHANKVSVDKQIMLDVARKDAIRTVLNGDRRDTHPDISDTYDILRQSCPSLFSRMIPWSLSEFEIDEQEQRLVGHGVGQPFANLAVHRALPASQAHFPVTLVDDTYFYKQLEQSYQRDYHMQFSDVPHCPRVHYRRRAFTILRDTEKQLVFQPGRWIHCGSSYAQIGAVFTHTRLDETRVFFVLHMAKCSRHDELLDCDVYTVHNSNVHSISSYWIAGLPAISAVDFFHFVPIGNTVPSAGTFGHSSETLEFWHNYRLQHFV
jgi:hypothetical protein